MKIITNEEIQARYPRIKSFAEGDTAFIKTENNEILIFITLTHAGIKEEGESPRYFFKTKEEANNSYLEHFFAFLNKEAQEDCELVWRMLPENKEIDFHNSKEAFGKIYPKRIITGHGIYSRLLIRKLTNNK